MTSHLDSIQLLNTAIVKSKEKKINSSYESRLKDVCNRPAMDALNKAIIFLADSEKISRDQAATQIIDTLRDLDNVWGDYVMMEGITKLKEELQTH
jgi:hypothetical protein